MLNDQDNELLTRIGPGTPAGELLRRYWHPISGAGKLTEQNPTKFVRILGEDLVLFKDKKGRVGAAGGPVFTSWGLSFIRESRGTGHCMCLPRVAF